MTEQKPSKKQRIKKIISISTIVISLILSSVAIYQTGSIKDLKSGTDGESSLTTIGELYGTHGCEKGGFSIQIGVDDNQNDILENDEISQIRNICHGTQGESGPMGNRGYWGYNGSDGIDGINGSDGIIGQSAFINSITGEYGACPNAVILEMGNNSTSQLVESSIKICFSELTSGILTDINENTGDSFSTACNGGIATDYLFIFAAAKDGNCLLYKMQSHEAVLVSSNTDFLPGKHLGFIDYQDRIWFDANDGTGTQLWSVNKTTMWKESNLTSEIDAGDSFEIANEELVILTENAILIKGDSETIISGSFSNLTTANDELIFNTANSISVGGDAFSGEIHSNALFHQDYYWFIATTDGNGPELHRSMGNSLERLTDSIGNSAAANIEMTLLGDNILFDSIDLVSFNTSSLTLSIVNSSIQNPGTYSNSVVHEEKLWFSCGISGAGYELCVSDGENAWLHSDYAPGIDSSNPSQMTVIGNDLVMIVNHPQEGGQLVKVSDGGFELLWDHSSGNLEAGVHGELWVGKDTAYFIADSANLGLEMYGWAHGVLSDEWIIIH